MNEQVAYHLACRPLTSVSSAEIDWLQNSQTAGLTLSCLGMIHLQVGGLPCNTLQYRVIPAVMLQRSELPHLCMQWDKVGILLLNVGDRNTAKKLLEYCWNTAGKTPGMLQNTAGNNTWNAAEYSREYSYPGCSRILGGEDLNLFGRWEYTPTCHVSHT